jgi:hypothetical protein
MANRKDHRRFGNVRQRASGRWQARYIGPDGLTRAAPHTFDTEKQAQKWLTVVEAEIIRGVWVPPEAGEVNLGEYLERWIAERKLAARTRELYEDLHRLYIRPHLGHLDVGAVGPQTIRTWRKRLLDDGASEPQAVKAYCVLRAVFNTAIKEDGIVRENPCRIRGYDRYHTPERPVATRRPGLRTRRRGAGAVQSVDHRRGAERAAVGRAGRASPLRRGPDQGHGPCAAQAGRAA